MPFRNRRELKQLADQALERASYDPRKLMLIYIGTSGLVMLAVTALNYFLQLQISGTGGLGGLGLRSILQTAVEVLQLAANLVMPFWTMGYLSCVLSMVRGQEAGPRRLLDGFRRFGPVLRLHLIRTFYLLAIVMGCSYLGMQIFMISPFGQSFAQILEPILAQGELALDEATLQAAEHALIPAMLIIAAVFAALGLPVLYSLRMADYILLDHPELGAMAAIRRSRAMMKGHKLSLFKLDLSFWWFYLLDGLALSFCYGDVILNLLGVELPIDGTAAYFVFYVLYLVAQILLYTWARNKVECTLALGYEDARRELDAKLEQLLQQMNQQL